MYTLMVKGFDFEADEELKNMPIKLNTLMKACIGQKTP